MSTAVKQIVDFIVAEMPIVKINERTHDTVMTCKCPVCGDSFRTDDRKNRVRAAFIIKDESIFYNCLNCQKSLSVSERIGDLAYLISKYRDITFSAAKQVCIPIARYYITQEQKVSVIKEASIAIDEIKIPSGTVTLSGIKWLEGRGLCDPNILHGVTQRGQCLYFPLEMFGKTFGYLESNITRKWYKLEAGGNDLNHFLPCIDDITPATRAVIIVESLIDAKLITQDSGGSIVGIPLMGAFVGEHRMKIIESLAVPVIFNLDSDSTGIRTIDGLVEHHPEWKAAFFNKEYKDYGDYRKKYNSIDALSYVVNEAVRIDSPKLKLQRVI